MFDDLNDGGRPKILLSGVNNEYRKGALVVLDPETIHDSSPQRTPQYRSPGLNAGTERYCILFPMSELDEIVSSELFVTGLETFEDGTITLTSLPTEIIFSLNRRMKLLFARASYGYDILYKQMLAEGRIKTPYDPGQTEVPWPIRAPDGVKAGWSP